MTYPISYGRVPESDFLDAGESIVRDFESGTDIIVNKINQTFFGGNNFAPKNLYYLTTCAIPQAGDDRQAIEENFSPSIIFSYAETIPFYGSAIAAISALGHLFLMWYAHWELREAVAFLRDAPRNEFHVNSGISYIRTARVFNAAVTFTVYYNHMVGSLLSIVPFLKPSVRAVQFLAYHCRPESHLHRV